MGQVQAGTITKAGIAEEAEGSARRSDKLRGGEVEGAWLQLTPVCMMQTTLTDGKGLTSHTWISEV